MASWANDDDKLPSCLPRRCQKRTQQTPFMVPNSEGQRETVRVTTQYHHPANHTPTGHLTKHGRPTVQTGVASTQGRQLCPAQKGAPPHGTPGCPTLNSGTHESFLLQPPQIHLLLQLLDFGKSQERNDNCRFSPYILD